MTIDERVGDFAARMPAVYLAANHRIALPDARFGFPGPADLEDLARENIAAAIRHAYGHGGTACVSSGGVMADVRLGDDGGGQVLLFYKHLVGAASFRPEGRT